MSVVTHNGKTITEQNPVPVLIVGPGSPSSEIYTDTVAIDDTAAAIGSQSISQVFLQADANNTEDIYIGNATDQLYVLKAGDSIDIVVNNLEKVYAKTAQNTASIIYMARS